MLQEIHCPLCIQPLQHNNPAFIFLDIDGVLIDRMSNDTSEKIRTSIKEIFSKKTNSSENFTELEWRIAAAHHFNQSPLENLNSLIIKIQKTRPVHIILSSQWRNDGTLEEIRNQMFVQHPFSSIIIGKTPPRDRERWAPEIKYGYSFEVIAKEKYNLELRSRANQITFWLRDHELENADFVILDDYDDDLSQRFPDRFVYISSFLTGKEVDEALKILKIPH
jgi:hypothetical protein